MRFLRKASALSARGLAESDALERDSQGRPIENTRLSLYGVSSSRPGFRRYSSGSGMVAWETLGFLSAQEIPELSDWKYTDRYWKFVTAEDLEDRLVRIDWRNQRLEMTESGIGLTADRIGRAERLIRKGYIPSQEATRRFLAIERTLAAEPALRATLGQQLGKWYESPVDHYRGPDVDPDVEGFWSAQALTAVRAMKDAAIQASAASEEQIFLLTASPHISRP